MAFNSRPINGVLLDGFSRHARVNTWGRLLTAFNSISGSQGAGQPRINIQRREEETLDLTAAESLVVQVTIEMNGLVGSANYDNTPNELVPFISLHSISTNDFGIPMITITDLRTVQ